MAKKIPGARLEVIRDAGHSSNLDQPEAFNRVLLDFLDGLPA
jgi:pimeloyl-ACP methyl ester carboxylesterase